MEKIIVANYRYFVSGGPEVYMFKFMKEIENYGYKAIPFSVKNSRNQPTMYDKYFIKNRYKNSVYFKDIKITPISIIRVLKGAFYNFEASRKLKKLIKKEKPKALFALQVINTLSPSIFKIAKKMGLTVIHRVSDFNLICPNSILLSNNEVCTNCINGNYQFALRKNCFHSKIACKIRIESMKFHRKHRFYDYVDYFMTPTDFTKMLLANGGISSQKIITIPTFIDASIIKPDFEHFEYLLFLGRLVPEKGVKYAIEALRYLSNYPNLKLKITGLFDDLDEITKTIIYSNNLMNRIEFVGFVKGEELRNLISRSLAVLCPAIWYENMPNTIIEAYAYGKPVIASNIGCFPSLVNDGTNGYLFEPKNSIDLANTIIKLIKSNFLEIGKYNRRIVEEKFNSKEHFSKILSLIK